MKRHLSRRRWTVLLAACFIPAINCSAAARATDCQADHPGAASAWASTLRDSLQHTQLADARSVGSATAYFGDVPTTVVGVYGATMLDMLSGGPLVLVKWPDGCCSASQRWHTGRHAQSEPANPDTDGAHIFFLWPES